MDINTTIQAVATILIAIITYIISPIIQNQFINKKFRNLQHLIDSQQILQNTEKSFTKKFIEPTIQENLFFILTRIKTNYKSINSYVELKDSLSENYDWQIIKSAKPHFKFDDRGKMGQRYFLGTRQIVFPV